MTVVFIKSKYWCKIQWYELQILFDIRILLIYFSMGFNMLKLWSLIYIPIVNKARYSVPFLSHSWAHSVLRSLAESSVEGPPWAQTSLSLLQVAGSQLRLALSSPGPACSECLEYSHRTIFIYKLKNILFWMSGIQQQNIFIYYNRFFQDQK